MEQLNVGKSGLRVSAVGLGCNNFGWTIEAAESEKIIHRALDLGVTLFDTAPVYGPEGGESETVLGAALGAARPKAVIVTKFSVPVPMRPGMSFNTSRATVIESLDASLRRLGTDYVDIYMLHWPDGSTPMEETLRALDDVISAGKARYIGCSNLSAWRLVEAKWISKTDRLHGFIVAQNEYSLAQREADQSLVPALEAYGIGFMPYAPLANGLLTGKYAAGAAPPGDSRLGKNMWKLGDRYLTDSRLALVSALTAFAQAHGHSLLELAISWLLARPMVCSVIGGATRLEQVEQNVAAAGWRLTAAEMAEIDKICLDSRGAGAMA